MFITGLGYYVPERKLDNAELSTMVETSDEWIQSRTGIAARHLSAPGEHCSDLCAHAARAAMHEAQVAPEEITHAIVCTVSGDAAFPSTACYVQEKLGIPRAMAFDIAAACSGFLYGLETANGLLKARPESVILLIGAESLSHLVNWHDRATCVLFGDGAGAAIVRAAPKSAHGTPALAVKIEGTLTEGDGKGAELLYAFGGGSRLPYKQGDVLAEEFFIRMNGQEVFKRAVRAMGGVSQRLLDSLGLTISDIDMVVPHQANLRIIRALLERLGVPEEKAFINLDRYGNTSAASIPMALAEAVQAGSLKPGMRVLMATFGAGLTWGAAVARF